MEGCPSGRSILITEETRMCLATPMEIISIKYNTTATVKQSNITADIDISLLENPKKGDYVIVHAGFAIEILDYTEAQERLKLFTKLAEIQNPAKGRQV